ncbi:hypothetical protein HanXRQr2_Chr08g0346181 [Helianthus annuus]|uniref:Uncharacterized protein n=1 Tax=Helianthus annuus TaxID=4232 RepID=A0A251U6Z0_HELAN|nr:hypothetical protein HanXRQr2_Chr08g0346181 [Helianthus annuus]
MRYREKERLQEGETVKEMEPRSGDREKERLQEGDTVKEMEPHSGRRRLTQANDDGGTSG